MFDAKRKKQNASAKEAHERLGFACLLNDADGVRAALAAGADPTASFFGAKNGDAEPWRQWRESALMRVLRAARTQSTPAKKAAASLGAPDEFAAARPLAPLCAGMANHQGSTALMLAIGQHDSEIVDFLWPFAERELVSETQREAGGCLAFAAMHENEGACLKIMEEAPWAIEEGDWEKAVVTAIQATEFSLADKIAAKMPANLRERSWPEISLQLSQSDPAKWGMSHGDQGDIESERAFFARTWLPVSFGMLLAQREARALSAEMQTAKARAKGGEGLAGLSPSSEQRGKAPRL